MASSQHPRVVIDTNIFVSGILYGGNAERVLRLFQSGSITLIISPEILAEILLTLKKFSVPETDVDELSELIQSKAHKVNPKEHIRVSRDPKDNMLLEAAAAGRADYLVTGDKDLLTLGSYGRTLVVTPREFLELQPQ
ncbi:MAG: putative toxin-antitoxin system toxin component, PIN family [Patescibacteria group bacterium]